MIPSDRGLFKSWTFLNRIKGGIDGFRGASWTPPQLVDSWVLRTHYRVTVGLFFLIFVLVTGDWYADNPMQCVNMFDRSEVWDYFQNLCLSYCFTNSTRGAQEDDRVYAAHYRWVHWTALLIMFLYYLPLVAARACRVPMAQHFLKRIMNSEKEGLTEGEVLQQSLLFVEELGWNAHVFSNSLHAHLLAILVNVISIGILDTLLQHKFILLVPSLYPFTRDSQHFSDPLSLLFPPFVTCKVGPEMMLLNYRSEVIGCHLPLMELYEKIFIGLWFWMLFLLVAGIFEVINLLVLNCCPGLKLKRISVGVELQDGDTTLVISRYSTGDIILLSMLKNVIDCRIYRRILHHAAYCEWPDEFDDDMIPDPEPILVLC